MKKAIVVGAGFGGLSAAAYLAEAGYDVTVLEKNDHPGGRAMVLKKKGFTFDMGPSWYMMPEVYDDFFADFGHRTKDFYETKRLNPSYRVYTAGDHHDVHNIDHGGLKLFEDLEPGSSKKVEAYLRDTKKEYDHVRRKLLELDYVDILDVFHPAALKMLAKPALIRSFHSRVKATVANEDLQKILEFMVVFMGGSPQNIPSLYTLLSHVDFGLGIWYPMGGFGAVVKAFESICLSRGVTFRYNATVTRIEASRKHATAVWVGDDRIEADVVVANADYHHVETELLAHNYQSYKEKYWQQKTLSPSAVLVYLGVSKKVEGLKHHTLFFDTDWHGHFADVFKKQTWSSRPMFYAGTPSKTDPSVAPKDHENIFLLAPMANGVVPTAAQRDELVSSMIARIEARTGTKFAEDIVVREVRDAQYFMDTFNAYRGNAFGLAHTLSQSAVFRPRMQSRKIKNLFYVGQYTNPGTGVPIVVLSGKVVARLVQEKL